MNSVNETVVISAANKGGILGGLATTTYGLLSQSEVATFVGTLVAMLGLVVAFTFYIIRNNREKEDTRKRLELAYREDARKEELHRLKIIRLKTGYHDE